MTAIALLALVSSMRLCHEPPVLLHYEVVVPESDARRLAVELKHALTEACQAYAAAVPERVEAQLHGSTAGYQDASRAPWWRAAQMKDGILHFQPVAVLDEHGIFIRVVRHEAAHIALQNRPGRPLPKWLEEGEAMRFSGEPGAVSAEDLLPTLEDVEQGLSRPRSREESRRAYLSAGAFVRWLGPWEEPDGVRDFETAYLRLQKDLAVRSR